MQTWFIAGSVEALAVFGFDAFRRAAEPPPTVLLATAAAALAVFVAFAKTNAIATRISDVVHQSLMGFLRIAGDSIRNDHLPVDNALAEEGLRRGDTLGVIGSALQSHWAKLAGVRISAEVPSNTSRDYWSASDSVRSAVDAAYWRAGVRAIVAGRRNARGDVPESEPLPLKQYFVKWRDPR